MGAVLVLAAGIGCRQDMFNQPKVKPLAESDFFADGEAARPPVADTVARGDLVGDRAFTTGLGPDGRFVSALPVPLTKALLLRGRERFDIFCSPCHGRTGDGRGRVVLVLGSEGRGLRPRVADACDQLVALPVVGRVASLNVSTAAAAILYEILQAREGGVDKSP